jgi:hypothetical protein
MIIVDSLSHEHEGVGLLRRGVARIESGKKKGQEYAKPSDIGAVC